MLVRHVGGILLTDGRRDHDTSYRVNRPRNDNVTTTTQVIH